MNSYVWYDMCAPCRYDAAVHRGDGAVLVEQSEASADVFKVRVVGV